MQELDFIINKLSHEYCSHDISYEFTSWNIDQAIDEFMDHGGDTYTELSDHNGAIQIADF